MYHINATCSLFTLYSLSYNTLCIVYTNGETATTEKCTCKEIRQRNGVVVLFLRSKCKVTKNKKCPLSICLGFTYSTDRKLFSFFA